LLLAILGPVIMRKIKQHKARKMKEKYFKQNHGLLLQQLISHKTDISERMIIKLKELEKATNGFDKARIVGGGGHGVVFKGVLDLQVVAIKKAKIIVQKEIDEFINEVAVLTQVKLLGCCLETEVPLLVYEFISNGTLYHHLHVEGLVSLKWDDRIRIAMEISRALSYLHSAAPMPIFHRDIKSSNKVLDDTLTAKLSDFGACRYVPIDRTGVTTAIQGTIGYLDPMYYYTGRLTDKSDVFSFGVLLLELLTRKKPFVYRSDGGEGLVSHFATLLTKGKLVDIIDPQVMNEECGEVQEVSILATMCTKLRGEDRPTMREVEMILGNLLFKKKQVSCNTVADGFGRDETGAFLPVEIVTTESSRQYTMEEEILLSARCPR
jgi:serine/threonine protein kinase